MLHDAVLRGASEPEPEAGGPLLPEAIAVRSKHARHVLHDRAGGHDPPARKRDRVPDAALERAQEWQRPATSAAALCGDGEIAGLVAQQRRGPSAQVGDQHLAQLPGAGGPPAAHDLDQARAGVHVVGAALLALPGHVPQLGEAVEPDRDDPEGLLQQRGRSGVQDLAVAEDDSRRHGAGPEGVGQPAQHRWAPDHNAGPRLRQAPRLLVDRELGRDPGGPGQAEPLEGVGRARVGVELRRHVPPAVAVLPPDTQRARPPPPLLGGAAPHPQRAAARPAGREAGQPVRVDAVGQELSALARRTPHLVR